MSITSAIVLFVVIWAVTFFLVLPHGIVTQEEDGNVLPGTPASAPADAMVRRKMLITTAIAAVAFVVVFSIIQFRVITLDDIPFLTPPSGR